MTFDGNGNPASNKGNTLGWDPENRLTSYGTLLTAGYNGDGLRGRKQNGAGVRTYFLYDRRDPVCELNSSGAVTATNTFGTNGLLSRHTSSGSTFYTFDPAGNVAQRLDSGQNVLSTAVFDAFGTTLAGGTSDPFGFGARFGYYTDGETGLELLTHRYYDAAQGRFLNRDPAGYSGGINLYAYAENTGPNGVDPSGTNVYRLRCGVSPFFGLFYAHVMLKMTDACYVCPWVPFNYGSFYGGKKFLGFSHGRVEFGEGEYQDTVIRAKSTAA